MAEYIERGAAIEVAMCYCPDDDGSCSKTGTDLRELLDELEALQAADVAPVRRGRWIACNFMIENEILDVNEFYKCSECGYRKVRRSHFCPNCGARMEVDE